MKGKTNVPLIFLGMWLHLEALRHGVTIVGGTGTGKSLLLKTLRLSLARVMREHPSLRLHLVDFDVKGDLYDIYQAFPPDCPVYDLNPFTHADVYDVMRELDDPLDIHELFAILIDVSSNETQKFFPLAGRGMGADLGTRHWIVARDVTTFRDLVITCGGVDAMRLVAASHATTEHLTSLLTQSEVNMSVIASLTVEMNRFKTVAALYHSNRSGRRLFSGSLLASRRSAVRLPFHLKAINTLSPLTRLFLLRIQQRVLAELVRDRLVPMIVDEAALMPGGIDLTLAGVLGRESGLCPVFAFQSEKTAGYKFGRELLEATLSNNKTFIAFHLPDRDDAEKAARRFSSFDGLVRTDSESTSKGVTTSGWSESVQPVENVTAGMIQGLNVPSKAHPYLEFFMATVPLRPCFHRIHIPSLVKAFWPTNTPAPAPAPRSPDHMILRPWDEGDRTRLKLS